MANAEVSHTWLSNFAAKHPEVANASKRSGMLMPRGRRSRMRAWSRRTSTASLASSPPSKEYTPPSQNSRNAFYSR
eukprot:2324597-Prymnesium_polylepis.1